MYQPGHGKFEVEDPATLLTELSTSTPRERAVAAAMRGHDDL